MVQILVFGPSTTYGAWDLEGGWVQRLRKWLDKIVIDSEYEEYYLVYNLGIDGDNSEGILKRFEQETKPRIWPDEETILMFNMGTNDSIFDNKTLQTNISQEDFRDNLERLVELARKYAKKIIFVGSKPIEESKVDPIPWVPGKSYKKDLIEKFDKIAREVFENAGLYFIDVYSELKKEDLSNFLVDGVHPSSRGHERIFQLVKNYLIKEKIVELR